MLKTRAEGNECALLVDSREIDTLRVAAAETFHRKAPGCVPIAPYDMGIVYNTSCDGGTRDGLETVGPVCAAG